MTPELRKAILELPLCEESLDNPTDLVTNERKRTLLLALQELFVRMQCEDISEVETV